MSHLLGVFVDRFIDLVCCPVYSLTHLLTHPREPRSCPADDAGRSSSRVPHPVTCWPRGSRSVVDVLTTLSTWTILPFP
jgi:hypothetical protein